jgi:hypothetical protein
MRIRSVQSGVLALLTLFVCSWGSADTKQDYGDNWGLPLGSKAPAISALDAQGSPRSFEDLRLENGLLVFFNRSADW